MSALEKKTDHVKWTGALRYRLGKRGVANEGANKNNKHEVLLRFEPTATVNKHWVVKSRMDVSKQDMKTATNMTAFKTSHAYLQGFCVEVKFGF